MALTRRTSIRLLAVFVIGLTLQWAGAAPAAAQQTVDLTAEERAWLAAHPVVRVATDPEFQPIESLDENGRLVGISADYLNLLERKTGVRFEVVPTTSWDEAIDLARTRNADMFSAATKSAERSEYMLFTTPHIELPGVIIQQNTSREVSGLDQLRDMRVGVVSGYVWQEWIKRDHPGVDLHPVSDVQSGLLLVSFGQLDAMVANLATATHFIQKLGVTNLRVGGETGYHARLAIGTRSDWPILNGILQKAVSAISVEENRAVLGKWIKLMPPSRFDGRVILWAALILAAVIGLAVVAALAWNRSL